MAVTDERIEEVLDGLEFPAGKEQVLHHAASHGADPDLQQHLQRIPNETYETLSRILRVVPRKP